MTLKDIIDNHTKIGKTEKLIIAYGVSCALESLHKNRVIHRNLNLEAISLDSDLHPYISDLYTAVQVDTQIPYDLTETTPEFTAPEFLIDPKNHQYSFYLDAYSYGMILYMLLKNENPFFNYSSEDIKEVIINNNRPKFDGTENNEWVKLIEKCWSQDQNLRPAFTEICDTIENEFIEDGIKIDKFDAYKSIFKRNMA